jgi:hypothetical protein
MSCFATPASWGLRASCRSALARATAPAAHGTGSRVRVGDMDLSDCAKDLFVEAKAPQAPAPKRLR